MCYLQTNINKGPIIKRVLRQTSNLKGFTLRKIEKNFFKTTTNKKK